MIVIIAFTVVIAVLLGCFLFLLFKSQDDKMRLDAVWMALHDDRLPDDKKVAYVIGVLKSKQFPFIPEEL